MKISVECAVKTYWDRIIEVVTNIEGLNAKYLGTEKLKPLSMNFEVEGDDVDEVVKTIKAAIKATDWGKAIMFRVAPTGQAVYFAK